MLVLERNSQSCQFWNSLKDKKYLYLKFDFVFQEQYICLFKATTWSKYNVQKKVTYNV